MVIGTGIDIIEVARIRAAVERESFVRRVFSDKERAYFESRNNNPASMAGTFAAKEAVAKALSVGFNGVGWRDIEILHDDGGKPYTKLYNGAKERMESLCGKSLHISISHIKELAVAQAILED